MAPPVLLCYRCEDRDATDPYYRVVPAGLMCLHGYLQEAGLPSCLYNFTGFDGVRIRRAVEKQRPALVGVAHFTYNHAASEGLYQIVRKAAPGAVIVGGGVQAAHLDEMVLRRNPALDLVVRGEGEIPLVEIARRIASGTRAWSGIPGVTYREGDGLVRNALPPLLDDLSASYSLKRYAGVHGVTPSEQFPFLTGSRGCPGTCRFCNSPRQWRGRVRLRSVDSLREEVRFLQQRFGFLYFSFRDDTFATDPPHTQAFAQTVTEKGPWFLWNCQSRFEGLEDETLLGLKRAGCEQIQFGVETTVPHLQRYLGKPFPRETALAVFQRCRRVGIRTSAYLISGIPGQTEADIAEDTDFLRRSGLQDAVVSPLCFYPGAALAQEAVRRGEFDPAAFVSGNTADLLARRDEAARRGRQTLLRFAGKHLPRNEFTLREIHGHLKATGRSFSALMDLGRHWQRGGRFPEAAEAFGEIVRINPQNPVGYGALADLAEAVGNHQEKIRFQGGLEKALQYL